MIVLLAASGFAVLAAAADVPCYRAIAGMLTSRQPQNTSYATKNPSRATSETYGVVRCEALSGPNSEASAT